jgi:hypothetical protein
MASAPNVFMSNPSDSEKVFNFSRLVNALNLVLLQKESRYCAHCQGYIVQGTGNTLGKRVNNGIPSGVEQVEGTDMIQKISFCVSIDLGW